MVYRQTYANHIERVVRGGARKNQSREKESVRQRVRLHENASLRLLRVRNHCRGKDQGTERRRIECPCLLQMYESEESGMPERIGEGIHTHRRGHADHRQNELRQKRVKAQTTRRSGAVRALSNRGTWSGSKPVEKEQRHIDQDICKAHATTWDDVAETRSTLLHQEQNTAEGQEVKSGLASLPIHKMVLTAFAGDLFLEFTSRFQ